MLYGAGVQMNGDSVFMNAAETEGTRLLDMEGK